MSGSCAQSCEADEDCCPAFGGFGCPGEEYPDNYTCQDGLCVFGGCAADEDCNQFPNIDDECHPVDGVGTCLRPCVDDADCSLSFGTSCVGVADDGEMFCAEEVQACEDDGDCGGLGVCDVESGACHCTSDRDCTDETFDTCVDG